MICLCCEGSGRAPATESVEQDGEDGTRALISYLVTLQFQFSLMGEFRGQDPAPFCLPGPSPRIHHCSFHTGAYVGTRECYAGGRGRGNPAMVWHPVQGRI